MEKIDTFDKFIGVTVIHDGREVVITGRVAKKTSPSGKMRELWEISPLSVWMNNRNNKNFNRWVVKSSLMLIEDHRPQEQISTEEKDERAS